MSPAGQEGHTGAGVGKAKTREAKGGRTSEAADGRSKIESAVVAICSGVALGVLIQTFITSLCSPHASLFLPGWSDAQQRVKTTKPFLFVQYSTLISENT